jgi:hypothetical protein
MPEIAGAFAFRGTGTLAAPDSANMMLAKQLRLAVTMFALGVVGSAAAACGSSDDAAAGADEIRTDGPSTLPGSGTGAPGAGSGGAGGGAGSTRTGLPCDVDAVLKARCQTCHSSPAKFGASAPLVTWDDLQRPHNGKKVYELLAARVHAESAPMPPSPQPRLDAKELATVDSWIKAGAPSSTAACTNGPPPDGVKPLSCTPDTVLKPTKPFVMQAGSALDQYTCFGVDINLAKKRHITALAPKVDNKQLVHHILLFQAPTGVSTEPFACEAFGSAAWKLVAGWAPGGTNLELPPAAGFPENVGTTHWVVQVHYNNATAKTGTDQSGYELCTTETLRPNDAGVLAFGSTSFSIPPRSTHTIRCDYALGPQFANVSFFNASPHMHTRGVAMSTERLPGGNASNPEPVFEQKAFSFEAQSNFPIAKSATTGDVMRTRCSWKNPSDMPIGFGEGTGDEMCFDFLGYYPNIPDVTLFGLPIFTWATPSLNATCVAQ